jgi:hypothetical protein
VCLVCMWLAIHTTLLLLTPNRAADVKGEAACIIQAVWRGVAGRMHLHHVSEFDYHITIHYWLLASLYPLVDVATATATAMYCKLDSYDTHATVSL